MASRDKQYQANDLKRVEDSITRPSNTTAYAAGDAVSEVTTNDHFTFSAPTELGVNTGEIVSAICHSSAAQGTAPDLELWLFHTDVGEDADNAAWTPTDAELLTCIGVIDFATANWKTGSGNSLCQVTNVNLPYKLARVGDGTRATIYGQLVMRNTYTPVSAEIFTVSMLIRQD